MAILIDRVNGQNYAENVVNPALSFNGGTWTVASGTGTGTLDTTNPFLGSSSLKVENTDTANDIRVTNASQDSTIEYAGDYQISWFAKKDIAQEVRSGKILIYKNAVILSTQSFSIGSVTASDDINDVWLRFQADTVFTLAKSDVITFQIEVDGVTTSEPTTFMLFDGFMINKAGRNNTIAPNYVQPNDTINRLINIPAPPTADGTYQLNVASGVYTWT